MKKEKKTKKTANIYSEVTSPRYMMSSACWWIDGCLYVISSLVLCIQAAVYWQKLVTKHISFKSNLSITNGFIDDKRHIVFSKRAYKVATTQTMFNCSKKCGALNSK